VDYGHGASRNNPDYESINVLKGPAPRHYMGARAANGAIIITTKKGNSKRTIKAFSHNSGNTMESVLPAYQIGKMNMVKVNNQQFCFC